MAVDLVGVQAIEHLNRIFQLQQNHEFAISSDLKLAVSSALNRSGHARFRRGPPRDQHAPSIYLQYEQKLSTDLSKDCSLRSVAGGNTSSFQSSSLAAGEGSVSNGKQQLGIVAPSFSSRKPPLPSSHRKRHSNDPSFQGSGNSVSRTSCHCCKRRKTGSKQKTRRIPVIGSKVESIPADDYSWKKYAEKKLHGSLFPRVYYKCNSAKGCPARKRVELLCVTDSKMLLVTYDGEHHHHHHTPTPIPTIQSK